MKKTYLTSAFLTLCMYSFATESPYYQELEEAFEIENLMDDHLAYQQENTPSSTPSTQTNPKKKFSEGINTPVRPMVKEGTNLWVMGEALAWQAVEDNLYYAQETTLGAIPANGRAPISYKILDVDFGWDWGFRIGAGYNIPYDRWDIGLKYTHMKNVSRGHAKDHGTTNVSQIWGTATGGGLLGVATTSAKGSWKVYLDQVDLELGREFFVGEHLTLRPHVGARSTFIFQRFRSIVFGFDPGVGVELTNDTMLKNQFWGFGFLAGLGTDWKLKWGFSIFGDVDFSLLFGFFKVHEKGLLNNGGEANAGRDWLLANSFRTEKPVFDLDLGLKWCSGSCESRARLTLKAAYEYHLYMNQNQWQQPTGNPNFNTLSATPGDLGYQGISLSAQLDF